MEQQTLSVAKAGLVCKLNTRTTIIAATNPKGKYDEDESVSVNTAIASPLLSRFDLCFVMLDRPNPTRDRVLSTFVLNGHLATSQKCLSAAAPLPPAFPMFHHGAADSGYGGYGGGGGGGGGGYGGVTTNGSGEEAAAAAAAAAGDEDGGLKRSRGGLLSNQEWESRMNNEETTNDQYASIISQANQMLEETWSIPKLQAYIAWVQTTTEPKMGIDAQEVLEKYYLYQRQTDDRNASRTTVRLLESLIRIAQAHARVMGDTEVAVDDAIIAVQLVDASMSNSSILGTGNTPMASFPKDADLNMEDLRARIMNTLKINTESGGGGGGGGGVSGQRNEEEEEWEGGGSQASVGSNASRWADASDIIQTTHHIDNMNQFTEEVEEERNEQQRRDQTSVIGWRNGENGVEERREEEWREEGQKNGDGDGSSSSSSSSSSSMHKDDEYYDDSQDPSLAALSQASGYQIDADRVRKRQRKTFE